MKMTTFDEAKVKETIRSGGRFIITTYTVPRTMEVLIEKSVTMFLHQIAQDELKSSIAYCVQELIVNAKKANTKRVYFMERGLNLSDPQDYKTGMAGFKEDTLRRLSHYLQLQREQGLYIRIILQIKNNTVFIEVRNNSTITNTELSRVYEKLVRARTYDSMDEAVAMLLDPSEGAGLGLVILTRVLQKMGLEENCFNIQRSDTETIARITIPYAERYAI